ncbi:hypothetical protein [Lentibacillus sp. CBA3610]|uniref:hypothetical protein n=1 Tax=Lentibacillus sp. CBA3610 TaxID=2518176 RepID=UPI0015953D74|nr:hypothetical protein [Lentibacillus sp. CBA3610]QKY71489.1 hypothetical protein Len3610_19820 [Lentibacillus sp. CBA3610]
MDNTNFIRQSLYLHDIPVYEDDMPYIQFLLHTVNQAQMSLNEFPDLNNENPITIVDKGLIYDD